MSYNHQDFRVVDIGRGTNQISNDEKIQQRHDIRQGNTVSLKKSNFSQGVPSKALIDATEAKKQEYCDGKEIIRLRNLKKLSQKELANKVNQKPQVIGILEQGKLVATSQNKILVNKIKNILR